MRTSNEAVDGVLKEITRTLSAAVLVSAEKGAKASPAAASSESSKQAVTAPSTSSPAEVLRMSSSLSRRAAISDEVTGRALR